MIDFQKEYEKALAGEYGRDLYEHLPWLIEYASKCSHVTEFGVGWGESTRGFLSCDVILHSYEIKPWGVILDLFKRCEEVGKAAYLHIGDILKQTIDETDLLLIDTYHSYDQLKQELNLHASKVRKYIFFHDTTLNGIVGTGGEEGLWKAINEFLEQNSEWKLVEERTNCNGMTLIERV